LRYGIPVLSLILPTYNEAENIPDLLPKIRAVLKDIPHEIIIVDDDSPDGTWKIAQQIAHDLGDVHVIRRIGRRGLSSAVIEGFLSAKGDVLAVMDADGQHDMALLTTLHAAVVEHGGIAIGSRYVSGGSVGEWDERRYMLSRIATRMALALCAVKAKDPMSGFFAVDRTSFEEVLPRLNPKGFKILLDLLVHMPKSTPVTESPFTFAARRHGESKLSRRVQLEFLEYLYDVSLGNWIPLTFVKYCIVGGFGVGVHLTSYKLLSIFFAHGLPLTEQGFSFALLGAIETAIVFNFWLNNLWTFAHAKLQGVGMMKGFLTYNLACGFGALANYAVSTYLYSYGLGEISSVIVGACAGIVWNYTMSRLFAWKNA
jgi:dolichol-phosphate mannosyltransferase